MEEYTQVVNRARKMGAGTEVVPQLRRIGRQTIPYPAKSLSQAEPPGQGVSGTKIGQEMAAETTISMSAIGSFFTFLWAALPHRHAVVSVIAAARYVTVGQQIVLGGPPFQLNTAHLFFGTHWGLRSGWLFMFSF